MKTTRGYKHLVSGLLTALALQISTVGALTPEAMESSQACHHDHSLSVDRLPEQAAPASEGRDIFADPESAVIAASNYFNPLSIAEDREYMGAVLRHRRQGHYVYTAAGGVAGEDRINIRLQLPKQYEVVAFWHTHGGPHFSRRYFSDVDTRLAKDWQVPFYLADFTGSLKVFHPDSNTLPSMKAYKLGLGKRSGYAKGSSVKLADKRVKIATDFDQWQALHAQVAMGPMDEHSCDSIAQQAKTAQEQNNS
ncbi:DUF4329 domain-containing protein [Pseudomaricurvus alkylphenolicus]|jgi:hypothetical protein|uniref:DUF4329 domain-containing protein n=1 Tax=Pseudomaricurvus alkylphenolicus TaxID=1306991 RepID=UPI001422B40E|nr:DUF4329 domain-containing protein [Pseudomaricurvus alkylphenolicus]NIB42710.1 DUF4329 domain-containing protein [Pseudomaricurvus alkylphenolicus]